MLTIAMPMSGEGKSFVERGFTFPKPLVEICGRPMVEWVLGSLRIDEPHRFVFICAEEHLRRFALAEVLNLLAPGAAIIPVSKPTAGALCSVLLASEFLNQEGELLIANADQVVDLRLSEFLGVARQPGTDGCILTFPSTHPKWSFAKEREGVVIAVAEKRPISNQATAGIYYFRSSREFMDAAEHVILKNAALMGEFFVAPVYNELILGGKRITTCHVAREQMHSRGTPEDVAGFVETRPRFPEW
jgi:NDP-sugar pyrophosphorylase family protein